MVCRLEKTREKHKQLFKLKYQDKITDQHSLSKHLNCSLGELTQHFKRGAGRVFGPRRIQLQET
jgi:hypothetical protein